MPLTKPLAALHSWVHPICSVIEIGVVTGKMWIDWETPHFCSKTAIVSQLPLCCFDWFYAVFQEQVWAAPLVLGHPALSPPVTLGIAALLDAQPFLQPQQQQKLQFCFIIIPTSYQSTSRSSGLQHFKRIRENTGEPESTDRLRKLFSSFYQKCQPRNWLN